MDALNAFEVARVIQQQRDLVATQCLIIVNEMHESCGDVTTEQVERAADNLGASMRALAGLIRLQHRIEEGAAQEVCNV